jgi:thymidine kinase
MIHFGELGFLKIILGPMFSGKTTELLNIYRLYNLCDISCCVINHTSDIRYHKTMLSSHDKIMIPCFSVNNLISILDKVDNYRVFLINEAQFFNDLYTTVFTLVEKYNKRVYICGLDGDFTRSKFGQIIDLIPLADEIEKKKAICMGCKDGTAGIFTQRLSDEKGQRIVGIENYRSVCRKCFNKIT